ncbi:amine oxidase [copper-containing] [Octopus vulgaris]|uniref:Amine oxidase [copper-containing] n=2 Tax=Octopus TaxID=6643 RepID=A0AA36AL75_OCTVU|nr:putative amine oxidase [copper-containing] [Octopus sinensis]CAI9717538.1 amine oxidase [copper-containing] [Octopus vulgaris]
MADINTVKGLFVLSVLVNISLLTGILTLLAIGDYSGEEDSLEALHCNKKQSPVDDVGPNMFELRYRKHRIFDSLNVEEIEAVQKYLFSQKSLNLVHPSKAKVTDNYIFLMESQTPKKLKVLRFLDHVGPEPPRQAKVIIMKGQGRLPMVEEYIVGPLPKPKYHYLNNKTAKQNPLPFRIRPYNNPEIVALMYEVLPETMSSLNKVLQDIYGAQLSPHECEELCLTFTAAPVSTSFVRERKLWIPLFYNLEFPTLHPIDFQLLININHKNIKDWKIEQIWHSGILYNSTEHFLKTYKQNSFPRKRVNTKKLRESTRGYLHSRGKLFPNKPSSGPQQFETSSKRYKIVGNKVIYMKWSFDYRVSAIQGLQLFDIRFGNDRIVYEMSLQEMAVLYSGFNPFMKYMHVADTVDLPGKGFGLVPGIDCPHHATFLNATHATEEFDQAKVYQNAICIFEFNKDAPFRRHHSNNIRGGVFYSGLVNNVLIVRTISVVYNYDYIFDYIFYQNGALEVKIYSTGFVYTTTFSEAERPYAVPVDENIVASIHAHLFHFKVDLDILGEKNRYETWDVKVENKSNIWRNSYEEFHQYWLDRKLKRTEKEAIHKYNFNTPKYHTILNNDKTNYHGVPRGYRIHNRGMVKQLLPENFHMESSISWSRYQMAVTQFKDREEKSSSITALFGTKNPAVKFSDFLEDDDDIVDMDLVTWLTLGTYHIPRSEDLPNVPTPETELSFLLTPFNYFPEDPSISSRNAVRLTPSKKKSEKLNVETFGTPDPPKCVAPTFSFNSIKSSTIFNR